VKKSNCFRFKTIGFIKVMPMLHKNQNGSNKSSKSFKSIRKRYVIAMLTLNLMKLCSCRLANSKILGLDNNKVNVNGGAVH
jgi:hypothetical protein